MAEISAPSANRNTWGLDALTERAIHETHTFDRDSAHLDTLLRGRAQFGGRGGGNGRKIVISDGGSAAKLANLSTFSTSDEVSASVSSSALLERVRKNTNDNDNIENGSCRVQGYFAHSLGKMAQAHGGERDGESGRGREGLVVP